MDELSGAASEARAEATQTKAPQRKSWRGGKPLRQRSPVITAVTMVLCVGLAVWAIIAHMGFYAWLYIVLAGLQGVLTFVIYRARGGWR
ncbi:MAG TPA: hypothetical protein VFB34_00340 [Chloroflexota bacterium]|nr:hypothetical protein [Chloroflexota bacterium]